MYLTIKLVQSWAMLIYIIAGICSLLIALDFFLTKDGILRKILIALFLAWSLHYLGAAYLFYLNVPRAILIAFGSLFTTIDFLMLCTLYGYFKWKQ